MGPLHGLPISLKDRFNIEGLESACGYVSWLGEKKTADSEGVLVKGLRRMGGVFFVKSNVCMSMLVGKTFRCNLLLKFVWKWDPLISGSDGSLDCRWERPQITLLARR